MKKIKELKANIFFKNLIKNAAGFSIEENVVKIFNLKDEVSETLLKNRLPNVKKVIIKPNLLKIVI